jgi:hypothetical protein
VIGLGRFLSTESSPRRPERLLLPAHDDLVPGARMQWWYWCGHLATEAGRRFAYVAAFFVGDFGGGLIYPSRMREFWQRLKRHWNRTDTLVTLTSLASLGLCIANCWWESVVVACAAAVVPIAMQALGAVRDPEPLVDALLFGAAIAFLWPVGEWVTVRTVGWWGNYVAPGFKLLDTPLYCVLIGWAATTYCYYWGRRVRDMGNGAWMSAFVSGSSALVAGAIGENLFVAARMWTYDASSWDWGHVPAFVPIAYGLGYATLPLGHRLPLPAAVVVFGFFLSAAGIGLGWAFGFFPR